VQFASLGSGSRGNATLVRGGDTLVMIDCGFSLRETTRRLARIGIHPAELDALLVTHEHADHAAGVAALSARYQLPVYMTFGTAASGRLEGCHEYRCFNGEADLHIGELAVRAVRVPHDAAEPCQYRLQWRDCVLGVLTDLGSVTAHVVAEFSACTSLVLEFNHDPQMLWEGGYPPQVKHRIAGDWGHLSNEQAADLLRQIDGSSLVHLVVAHLSEQNNSRVRAEQALRSVLGSLDTVVFAGQSAGFDWLRLN